MHASLTGGVALILIPLDAKGWPLVTWYLVFSGALAAVEVALVGARRVRRLSPGVSYRLTAPKARVMRIHAHEVACSNTRA